MNVVSVSTKKKYVKEDFAAYANCVKLKKCVLSSIDRFYFYFSCLTSTTAYINTKLRCNVLTYTPKLI